MKVINGKYHYQVKDVIRDLQQFPQESIVFATWVEGHQFYHKRPIYKTAETADPGEVFIHLGDDTTKESI